MNNFLSISKSAANHIRKIMEDGAGKALRIGLKKGGCAGMEYTMEYVNEISDADGISERMIMEAIHEFSGQKTIIMIAHRLKTVQKCDQIFFIDRGELADQGSYEELIERNEHFKNMAAHV